MALDWDNIVIKTDEYSYSLDSEQRMIIFEGQPGAMGPSGGVTIGSVETLPAGSSATVTNTGTFSSAILNFGIPRGADGDGSGNAVWGHISGTLSDQTDLSDALDEKADATSVYSKTEADTLLAGKANTADLGDMSTENDAPSDGSEYVRKNGAWSVSSGGGGGSASWGGITGALSDQTDLQAALDLKSTLVSLAPVLPDSGTIPDGIYYNSAYDRFEYYSGGYQMRRATLGQVVYYLLNTKANSADLGDLASENDAPSDGSEYIRKNGQWSVSSGGGGSSAWGDITGTLSNQTDLNTALNGKADASTVYTKTEADNLLSAKANTADLGDLAAEDDAPSDNAQYARKNGAWDQIATPAWGAISGTLSSQTDLQTALNAKQGTLTFDSTPTAGSTNPVTSGGVKSYVDSHDDFKIAGTVSSSGYTLTDSRINDEHWEVEQIYFATPSNVTSADIDWSTNITNHTLTLSATYSGSTNVVVNMHWVQ